MSDAQTTEPRPTFLARFLALNRTVGVVLVSVLCFGLGEQLWEPLMPNLFRDQSKAQAAEAAETGVSAAVLLTVGLYSFLKNLVKAFCFFWGGNLTARLGDRRSLALFGVISLAGYVILLAVPANWAALVAAVLILSWEPLSVPVTFTTVAGSVKSKQRGLAFAVQSIQKRLPKIIGPAIAGFLLHRASDWSSTPEDGRLLGMRFLIGAAFLFGVVSLAIQYRWMPADTRTEAPSTPTRELWRSFSTPVRRLLLAEVFMRWCDWLLRDLVILYLVVIRGVTLEQVGLLLALQNLVSLLSYLPIGRLTLVVGTQPFIGLTFVFTAVFPVLLAIIPTPWLAVAFVAYGLREVGDPARKALLTDLLPAETRARSIGLFWGVRTFLVSWSAIVGAALWVWLGPDPLLYVACGFGVVGAAIFYLLGVTRQTEEPAPQAKDTPATDHAGQLRKVTNGK